ncbi:intracellular septation protein A [Caulobacter sp. CCUG 60055]|nr:septation protein IspZ [Caulobacter sp. CCUG 60055]MBQ1543361.1 septation protein IspZ [Caulobacteraceae bacterium]MCI3179741.1 intracellular septation protein A [Caulobacter sp. CCUG 60055]
MVVDYAGLVVFGGVYLVSRNLMTATWGLVAGSAAGLLFGLAMQRKLALLPLFTGLSAMLFGGLSLVFHNTVFIKMKLTIVDGLLAAGLFGALAFGKLPLKVLLGEALKLSDGAWRRLTVRYAAFFIFAAVVNEVVWRTQPEATWVLFRFPGVPLAALLFSFTQLPMMMKDMKAQEEAAAPPPPSE